MRTMGKKSRKLSLNASQNWLKPRNKKMFEHAWQKGVVVKQVRIEEKKWSHEYIVLSCAHK